MEKPALTTTAGKTYDIESTDKDFTNLLCNYGTSSESIKIPTTVGDVDVVKNTILGINFANDKTLTSIGSWFLYGCTSFNQQLKLPNSVTAIGVGFLEGCASFNQPLVLPESLTSIGGGFLVNCVLFNQPLIVPNSVISIGCAFLGGGGLCFV